MTAGRAIAERDRASGRTRRAILRAAEHLLATVGEDGLSIREVCARAGVTAPTIYHHFGDKRALVDRVVDDCFVEFDRTFRRPDAPPDPVARLAWSFDRYVEYGLRHPTHYRLMFQRAAPRPTPAGQESYEGLRRLVAAAADAGRLAIGADDAAAAFWSAVHGVTSILISGFLDPSSPVPGLVRDAMLAHLTRPAPTRAGGRPRRRRRTR
ncbi:MAG TPA: TetR/AcrR family transcriptional regulator [Candidatus Binatia bacterium]|nr:TetR/AcrR family transcriptional regulator [Candidatus Binatia bacterium]